MRLFVCAIFVVAILCPDLKAQKMDQPVFGNSLAVNVTSLPLNNTLQFYYKKTITAGNSFVISPKLVLPFNDLVSGYGIEGQYCIYPYAGKRDPDFNYSLKDKEFYLGLFVSYDHVKFNYFNYVGFKHVEGKYYAVYEEDYQYRSGLTFGFLLGGKWDITSKVFLESFFGLGTGMIKESGETYKGDWSRLQRSFHPISSGLIVKAGINLGITL